MAACYFPRATFRRASSSLVFRYLLAAAHLHVCAWCVVLCVVLCVLCVRVFLANRARAHCCVVALLQHSFRVFCVWRKGDGRGFAGG